MAYAAEVHQEYVEYEVVLDHVPSTTRLTIRVSQTKVDGTPQTEANRDLIFQAFLDKLVTLPNTSLVSCTKKGTFKSTVTPTP